MKYTSFKIGDTVERIGVDIENVINGGIYIIRKVIYKGSGICLEGHKFIFNSNLFKLVQNKKLYEIY